MVFVKASPLTWFLAHIIHWVGFAAAFSGLGLFVVFTSPFIKADGLPQFHSNPYFRLEDYMKLENPV
jgi:hypothetical protein